MSAKSILGAAAIYLISASPCPAQTVAELLQKGVYTQEAVGDLDGAIRIYRQVLTAPSARRAAAAQAQGRIVECLLEKGDTKSAAREFDKLTHDYAEFKDLIRAARARVDALAPGRERVALKNGPTRILSAIRGTVTDVAGRPLRRAQIRLTARELGGQPRTATTDEDGRYELTDLPAARYTVSATRNGYLPLRHGQRRPLELGRPLQLLDGQVIERVDFMLPRMGVIAGTVTDETGDPIADVLMLVLRPIYFDGRRQLVPAGPAPLVRTDEEGQYRITGLAPGAYVVMAQTPQKWTNDEGGREVVMSYAATYYPGTAALGDARPISVGIGQELTRIDISLIPARTAKVSGVAVDSHGRPFKHVMLSFEIRGQGVGMFGAAARTTVADDGRFTIADVPPGHYKLEATTLDVPVANDGAPEVAILPIDVAGDDIGTVTLTGSTGGAVSGTVVADAGSLPNPKDIRIRIAERMMGQPEPLRIGTFGPGAGFGAAELHPDGTFSVDHVFGSARFDVTVPEGWALKSILQDGRDITDAPIALKSGERLTDVQIVLTRRLTTLSGEVLDDHAPTSDGTIVVFAADRDKWFEDSRFVRAVRPDQQGRYQ